MPTKKKSVRKNDTINVSGIPLEIVTQIDKLAKKRQTTRSAVIGDILEKHIGSEDEAVDTIILKIPSVLRTKSEELKSWLDVRVVGIIKALTTSQNE